MKLNHRVISMEVAPEGENFLHERAFTISLRDEGGGEYVEIEQIGGKLSVEVEEWDALASAVKEMVCRIDDSATMHGGAE